MQKFCTWLIKYKVDFQLYNGNMLVASKRKPVLIAHTVQIVVSP